MPTFRSIAIKLAGASMVAACWSNVSRTTDREDASNDASGGSGASISGAATSGAAGQSAGGTGTAGARGGSVGSDAGVDATAGSGGVAGRDSGDQSGGAAGSTGFSGSAGTGGSSCSQSCPLGSPCTVATACLSGNCVDGVCCNTACDIACMGCTRPLTAGQDGICSAVSAGVDECLEGACTSAGKCQCADGLSNGFETGIDCGGNCAPCQGVWSCGPGNETSGGCYTAPLDASAACAVDPVCPADPVGCPAMLGVVCRTTGEKKVIFSGGADANGCPVGNARCVGWTCLCQ